MNVGSSASELFSRPLNSSCALTVLGSSESHHWRFENLTQSNLLVILAQFMYIGFILFHPIPPPEKMIYARVTTDTYHLSKLCTRKFLLSTAFLTLA